MKPTQTGNYWLAMPSINCVTKKTTYDVIEIVLVVFGYIHRGKPINKVIAKFWNSPLDKIPETAKWSEMIIPPKFD
jgi:hypothetical protein